MRSTVLIIDDSATFREYLRRGLESAGYEVLTAQSGEQGLSISQSGEIDAFVVDNVLPGIDGAAVVRRLRQQVRHRRTPSLLLTASDDPAQELTALEAGADAFVRKEETIEVVLARLASILRSVGTPARSDAQRQQPRAPWVLFVNATLSVKQNSARCLSEEGVVVHLAENFDPVEGDYDCIVINVGSVSRGSGFVGEVRRHFASRPPRLVLLGESESRSELVDAIALGADDYLPLSAGDGVLTARLHAQLRRKQLEDENELARENLMRHRMELESQTTMAAARAAIADELRLARDLAEEKAREAENLLAQNEAVFRSMAEGLVISDLEGNFVQVNQAALDIFGVAGSSELQDLLQSGAAPCEMRTLGGHFVPPSDWPLALASRGVSVSNMELQFTRTDRDHSFIGSFNAAPVDDRNGARILAAVTVRDITAQKRSEEILRRTEQLAVTGRLAASIAHEINNPLSAVMNLLYLIEGHLQSGSAGAELLSMAEKELRRVADITRQTLAFYRDSNNPVEVDVCALAREVRDLFSAKLNSASLSSRLELECEARPCAFPGELRQAISNLFSNAIDASSRGGEVRIRVRASHMNGMPAVRVSVADRGSGIPRAFYPDVFKPFYSLKGMHGTGLGLWVTQSIVARHEGRIRFYSRTQTPSGTVFSMLIPVSPSMHPERPDTFNKLFRELGNELLAPSPSRAFE